MLDDRKGAKFITVEKARMSQLRNKHQRGIVVFSSAARFIETEFAFGVCLDLGSIDYPITGTFQAEEGDTAFQSSPRADGHPK